MAIYHDRFIDLKKELCQLLVLEQVREMTGDCILLFRQFVSVAHFCFFSRLSPEALLFCLAISSGKPEQIPVLTRGSSAQTAHCSALLFGHIFIFASRAVPCFVLLCSIFALHVQFSPTASQNLESYLLSYPLFLINIS